MLMIVFKKISLPQIKNLTLPRIVRWGLVGLGALAIASAVFAGSVYYVYVYQLTNTALGAKPNVHKLLEADLTFLLKRFDERVTNLAATTTVATPPAFR